MREESKVIVDEVTAFIHRYSSGIEDVAAYENEYNELALQLFRFQFQFNPVYKRYCQSKRRTPLTVKDWKEIPPVSIQGFKELTLSCEPIEEAESVFMTSGTTNPEKKGRNYHPTLQVWDASMKGPFQHYVLPDCEEITIYVLSPAEDLNQNSSLSRYLSIAVTHFGAENSKFFFKEDGLHMQELAEALKESEKRGERVLLMGATFAYVHFLDYCKEHGLKFTLPIGSRVFDTGGFKGQSREVEMEELYTSFSQYFAVGREYCINMYGMTELSSQFYDQTILSTLTEGKTNHTKTGPAWMRTLVLDANTLEPVAKGKEGVLAHYDLANWNSSLAILTEDTGYETENGFVLLGRIKGSEARGCSVAVDQLLQAKR